MLFSHFLYNHLIFKKSDQIKKFSDNGFSFPTLSPISHELCYSWTIPATIQVRIITVFPSWGTISILNEIFLCASTFPALQDTYHPNQMPAVQSPIITDGQKTKQTNKFCAFLITRVGPVLPLLNSHFTNRLRPRMWHDFPRSHKQDRAKKWIRSHIFWPSNPSLLHATLTHLW